MANTGLLIQHTFYSNVADTGETDKVGPSQWNGNNAHFVIGNLEFANVANSPVYVIYDQANAAYTQANTKMTSSNTIIGDDSIEINGGGSGDRVAFIDFHGDDTYSDYGLRIIRWNTGANADSGIEHHGTGRLNIQTLEAGGDFGVKINGTTRLLVDLEGIAVTGQIKEKRNAIGSIGGGTQDIDLSLGTVVTATVDTSATTFTFSNAAASGQSSSFTLILTNGGSQTVNWPASVDWAAATAPTLTAAGVDTLEFITEDGGTTWYGYSSGLDMG